MFDVYIVFCMCEFQTFCVMIKKLMHVHDCVYECLLFEFILYVCVFPMNVHDMLICALKCVCISFNFCLCNDQYLMCVHDCVYECLLFWFLLYVCVFIMKAHNTLICALKCVYVSFNFCLCNDQYLMCNFCMSVNLQFF
jgi:hypothetical protein